MDNSMIAAIDFGTTFSCYAYTFDKKPKIDDITVNNTWGSNMGIESLKVPTSVLTDSTGHFIAFGYEAEYKYAQSSETDKGSHLFRHFKMMLYHEQNLNESVKIASLDGKQQSAMDIFVMAIEYLKDHLLKAASKQNNRLDKNRIKWVLTIPAIWNEKAKQFMRKAAFNAGLMESTTSDQLQFALEPEAASVLCRTVEENYFEDLPEETMEVRFPSGTKYMIIDAGGGTIDITAHEIIDNGNMVELMCATGGEWGGLQVDFNFERLLCELFGQKFVEMLKQKHPTHWLSLITSFETKKKGINMSGNNSLSVKISAHIADLYEEFTGNDIEDTVRLHSSKGIHYTNDNLVVDVPKAIGLFTPVADKIVANVKALLVDDILSNLKYILLVGGFGSSKILFERLKNIKDGCIVLSPYSANMSVVKGAILFALKPRVVTARIARKTYGQWKSRLFMKGEDHPSKKYTNEDGEERCRDLFEVHVWKGQRIDIDSCKMIYSYPPNSADTRTTAEFYCTDASNVKYVDEAGVTKLGSLTINISRKPGQGRLERKIEQRIFFGRTEIMVELEDKSKVGGEIVKTSIDFLDSNVMDT